MPSATQVHESRPNIQIVQQTGTPVNSLVAADLIQIRPGIGSDLLQGRDILIRHIPLEGNHVGDWCCEIPVAVVARY